jgi:choline kinase/phosphatidylglycerophosphate synthase
VADGSDLPSVQPADVVEIVPGRRAVPVGRELPRPRAAVVLAAGRSERLQAVTGGGSKALVRLGGLALAERTIRTLLSAGIERIIVVVGYHAGPVAAVAQRIDPGRVHTVIAEDWEAGNGASLAAAERILAGEPSFLLLTADHVFSEGALKGIQDAGEPAILVDPEPPPEVLAEATRVDVDEGGLVRRLGKEVRSRVADCGAFLLGPTIFRASRRARSRGDASLSGAVTMLAREEGLRAVPLEPGAWWHDVDTPEDLAHAKTLLRASLPRSGDGPVARILNRRLSIPISWILAPLRPSPNLLSVLSFVVGIAAAALLASGEGLVGGILAQACSVLDGVDGEVARLTVSAGPRGTLLDGSLDRLSDAALAGGLGLWAVDAGATPGTAVVLTAAAVTGSLLSMATKDRIAALGLKGPSERALGWLMGGRDGRLLIIAVLAIMQLPVTALAVVTGTSLLASFLRVVGTRTSEPS